MNIKAVFVCSFLSICILACDVDHAPVLPTYIEGYWSYIDTTGTKKIVDRFIKSPGYFSEGLAPAIDRHSNRYGYLDSSGNWVIKPKYKGAWYFKNNRAIVESEDRLYGYIDAQGNEVIPIQYEDAYFFSEGFAVIEDKKGFKRFIDRYGNVMFPDIIARGSFSEGLAAARLIAGKRSGYIDYNGMWVIKPQFGIAIEFSEGLAYIKNAVIQNGGFINKNGELVIDTVLYNGKQMQYLLTDELNKFHNNRTIVYKNDAEGFKTGFIDRSGSIVIEPRFDDCGQFSEGLAWVKNGSKYGFIDTNGAIIIPPVYDNVKSFHNGLAAVNIGAKILTGSTVAGGKWGFIDKTGEVIIPIQYDDVRSFSGGMAAVCDGCKWIVR